MIDSIVLLTGAVKETTINGTANVWGIRTKRLTLEVS
jgi:hypothetical protein